MTDTRNNASGPLILASASPRRDELLTQAGYEFEVVVSEVAEPERAEGEPCDQYVTRAAALKARSVARSYPGTPVLGADTIVVVDDTILGKPEDEAEAEQMLLRLSGRTHEVLTGVALAYLVSGMSLRVTSGVSRTRVTFRALTPDEVTEYVRTGEPMDKAGAYGIQGLGGRLVAGYDGSYTNVVGLPMDIVAGLLARADWPDKPPACPAGSADGV